MNRTDGLIRTLTGLFDIEVCMSVATVRKMCAYERDTKWYYLKS